MFMSVGRVLLTGVVATAVMDILSTVARKAHLVAPLPPTLLGRWIASNPLGHVRQASIDQAVPVAHELVIALLAHYAVGVVFASLYLFATSRLDISPRSAGVAVTFGLATCVFPWLLMFPAMGFGLFGVRGPPGTQLFLSSLVGHASYGVGIWLSARVSGIN
jgi:hypothetical protein